jgi:nitroreductase
LDALEAIRERRMLPRLREDRPSKAEVSELLEFACRAPTHHLTEPWRFHVLAGDGLERMARAIAADAAEAAGGTLDDHMEAGRAKASRAPVIIVVTCVRGDGPKVVASEEDASVAMAVQNILVAAYAMGLGAMLRTGTVAYNPGTNVHLGLEPDERIMGFVYLGYPAADRPLTRRAPAADRAKWVGWD